MFSRPKILFLVSLLFVALLNSIPTYLLNFYFFIILVILQPIAFIMSFTVIVNDEKLKPTITLYMLQYIRNEI